MRIETIEIAGLFGIFNHAIPLNLEERITIIHGPNGFGKTATLRLVNGVFNSKYSELKAFPFNNLKISFDDSSSLDVGCEPDTEKDAYHFTFQSPDSSEPQHHTWMGYQPDKRFPLEIIEDCVPNLERFGARTWMYLPTGDRLSLEEVLERFGDRLPVDSLRQTEPEWLTTLKQKVRIHFIESQRLLNISTEQRLLNISTERGSRAYRRTPSVFSTVSAYSDELAERMQDRFKAYGNVSQSLDRTYPARVVKHQSQQEWADEQLRQKLHELEETRTRLIEVGLLDREEEAEFQIQPQDIDESTKNALAVYVEDVEKKLDVFKNLASKIELLRKIINAKFAYSYKTIAFDKRQGFVFTSTYRSTENGNSPLSPQYLSSGEQHELVLLYELLFKVDPNSLVLIDEPELSLHVGWQSQFLQDLQAITELADLDILLATHAPSIIADRWDLTVELKQPEP